MKKNQWILGLVVLAVLTALVVWGRNRIHFDFADFRSQLALADWTKIGIAAGCIYLGYVFRSVRWALLLRHNKKVPLLSLLGTQVMGFTAVALIGRVADPVRPYLVSKKTGLPLSSQIAVYIVERLFDAGAMALVGDSPALGTTRWLGLATMLRPDQRGAHDQRELRERVLAILDLVARQRRRDDQRTLAAQPAREFLEEPRAIVRMQRGRAAGMPAQVDLARHLVDVLATRATRPRERDRQLAARDG